MKKLLTAVLATLMVALCTPIGDAYAYDYYNDYDYSDDYYGDYYDYSDDYYGDYYDYSEDYYGDYYDYSEDYYGDYYDYSDDFYEGYYDSYSDYYDNNYNYHDYIKVDIENQSIELYKANYIVLYGSIVSGQLGLNDTPKGVYSIQSMCRNIFLMEDYYVSYWMPFYGAYGIHDADGWRQDYGGDIYTQDGSHGCVNMPEELARELYNNSYIGMKVIVE